MKCSNPLLLMIMVLLMIPQISCSFERLHEKYLVTFGDPEAPLKVTEYYSFQCPHCIALFRKDFKKIQEEYIHSKNIYWTFHPIPADLLTVQGLVCLSQLNEDQKRLYLEAILEEAEIADPNITALMMIKAMELFGKPLPKLQEENFLQNAEAFRDAFEFLTQGEEISAVPTIEVNAKLFPNEIPTLDFIKTIAKKRKL